MTLSRKQREIRQREELVLDVARKMLLERGYLGLTMDRVAEATEYSKGTIYQHFKSKEDLVAAIAARSGELRAQLFERAATFQGSSRERIGAVGAAAEIFRHLYPEHETAEKIFKTPSIREKAGEERRETLNTLEFRCLGVALGIAREAVAANDLQLPEGHTVESLVFGLWSLYMGSFQIMDFGLPIGALGPGSPHAMMLGNAQLLLDGVGWRPLSTEHDYFAARERALREVFPQEARSSGLLA